MAGRKRQDSVGPSEVDGSFGQPVKRQKVFLLGSGNQVTGFKNPVSAKPRDEKPKVPNESKDDARKDKEKKRNDRRAAGQPKLKESQSHAGREVLVTAAIDSKLSVPMSKTVRAEYILVGDGLAITAFLKYLLSLMDTGTQKSNMRSIPVHFMLNDVGIITAMKAKAVVIEKIPILDIATRTTSDFRFENGQELLSRLDSCYMTAARSAVRLFSGKYVHKTPTGDEIMTCAYHAQRSSTVAPDPQASTPFIGAGAVTDGWMLISNEEQVEFPSCLHPRRIAIVTYGHVNNVDFDTMRTAAIEIVRGAGFTALPCILSLYECLREPYTMPLTQGQELAMRELISKPIFQSFSGLIEYLRCNVYAYHLGLIVSRDYQDFLEELC